jgi:CubicO group peptidase (beta-lactamase class C family)
MGAAACSADQHPAASGSESGTPVLDPAVVAASEPDLDAIVDAVMKAEGTPGVAVAVVHGGAVVITKGYGVREAGTDLPVDADTVFQIASLSKPLGSTVVAGAVGRGDIAWDQPVSSVLPAFALSDGYVTDNVTLADLYSHRSGLPGGTAGNDLETAGFTQPVIIERLRYLPLAPFRTTYSYSNFGMTVGGLAAAAASGTTFADLADTVLFGPAGMTSTSFRYDDFAARENATRLHVKVSGDYQARFVRNADAQAPAGGASSNVTDLARWMLLQLGGGALDGEQIIDAAALAETKRPQIRTRHDSDPNAPAAHYGLGWDIGPSNAVPDLLEWSHGGAFIHGAGTVVRILPALGLGVVVLTNGQPYGVAEAIADAYIDTVVNGAASLDWFGDGWGPVFRRLFEPTNYPAPTAPQPAQAASAYTGTYRNDYFGVVVVREGADGLELVWEPEGSTPLVLTHFDADTFLIDTTPQIQGTSSPVSFLRLEGAEAATALVLGPLEGAADWQKVTRVD